MKQADHLAERAREAREQAKLLPRGKLKDALLEKAGEYEAEITAQARPDFVVPPVTSCAKVDAKVKSIGK